MSFAYLFDAPDVLSFVPSIVCLSIFSSIVSVRDVMILYTKLRSRFAIHRVVRICSMVKSNIKSNYTFGASCFADENKVSRLIEEIVYHSNKVKKKTKKNFSFRGSVQFSAVVIISYYNIYAHTLCILFCFVYASFSVSR